jgi:glycosyltransferase involved in cell wall biosynthesis
LRILIPWFKFPPFEEDRIGGLSVVIWDITHEMQRQGIDVEVMVPTSVLKSDSTFVDGIRLTGSIVADRLTRGMTLSSSQISFFEDYDGILAIQGLGAKSYASIPAVKPRLSRQMHNVLSAVPLSYALTLHPSIVEYVRKYVIKKRHESDEMRLRGVKTICVSRHLSHLLIESGSELEENVHVIPNGVDLDAFRPMDVGKVYDLLFVGGYYWVKGLDLLLQALTILHKEALDLRVAIVGNFMDSAKRRIMASVPETVGMNLVLLGVVPHAQMPHLVNSARVVVVPSRYETFGLVALEAMACGVPVLASKVAALPELVDDTVGRLVYPIDGPSWAGAIRESFRDEEMSRKCIKNGPTKAAEYGLRSVVERLTKTMV